MRKGLLIVNTGHGKGKTTAALGVLLRAWGQGFRPCVIQFLKAENAILRRRLPRTIRVTPAERMRLVRLGQPLGSAIRDLISIVSPRTFTRWVNGGSQTTSRVVRKKTGRPQTADSIQQLVLRICAI